VALIAIPAAFPAAASAAGTVSLTGGGATVKFDAAGGDANRVSVTANRGSVTITDTAATITTAEPGCAGTGTNTVTCTGPTIVGYLLNLLDGADQATAGGAAGGTANGGTGADTLTGSNDNTELEVLNGDDDGDTIDSRNIGAAAPADMGDGAHGGAGVDSVKTGAGDDVASGDQGNGDNVQTGDGNDLVTGAGDDGTGDTQNGGEGFDRIQYLSSTPAPLDTFAVDLSAATAKKTNNGSASDTITSFEDVTTGEGGDQVTGTGRVNNVQTAGGDDNVNPGDGGDDVSLGDGDDKADLRDGSSDRVRCGRGNDTVQVDQFDEGVECEVVQKSTVRRADTKAPTCKIRGFKARMKRRSFFRGFRIRVICNERVTLLIRVVVRVRRASGIVLSRAGDLVVFDNRLGLGKASRRAKVKPSRKVGRLLPRRFRARLQVEARDEVGNRRLVSRKLRVR
jgi:hypothetical protein